jgi:hypothetical protein
MFFPVILPYHCSSTYQSHSYTKITKNSPTLNNNLTTLNFSTQMLMVAPGTTYPVAILHGERQAPSEKVTPEDERVSYGCLHQRQSLPPQQPHFIWAVQVYQRDIEPQFVTT